MSFKKMIKQKLTLARRILKYVLIEQILRPHWTRVLSTISATSDVSQQLS